VIKDNKHAIEHLNKINYKFNNNHLRQCVISSNNLKTYNIVSKSCIPTKEDFEYCLFHLTDIKKTKLKILKDMYSKIVF
jgi:hypothetical protein